MTFQSVFTQEMKAHICKYTYSVLNFANRKIGWSSSFIRHSTLIIINRLTDYPGFSAYKMKYLLYEKSVVPFFSADRRGKRITRSSLFYLFHFAFYSSHLLFTEMNPFTYHDILVRNTQRR